MDLTVQSFMNAKEGGMTAKDLHVLSSNNRLKDEYKNSSLGKEMRNAGYDVDIDTLTGIKQRITTQRHYEAAPAKYLPVVVGENAWSDNILTWRTFDTGDDFEAGIIEPGTNDSRLATSDTQIDSVSVPVVDWGFETTYNLSDLAKASRSGNFSLIESKEKSRFKRWQLGIQKIAFIGAESVANVNGLLTQSDVTANTSRIPTFIKNMTETQFNSFLGGFLSDYFDNSDSTILPDTFVIPTEDFLGLGTAVSENFGLKSRLQRIEETVKMVGNENFKVLPLAYANKARNLSVLGSGTGLNRYTLLRYDEESIRMDIPVDYTTTVQDTINGFNYQSVGYGEFTGVKAYRPKEMLYFDHEV